MVHTNAQKAVAVPELPEVETIKRGLAEHLVGAEIAAVELPFYKSLLVPGVSEPTGSRAGPATSAPKKVVQAVEERLVGAKIEQLSRRGKVLIWRLDNALAVLIHLKMTGQLVLVEKGGQRFAGGHPTESMQRSLPDSSTRIIFVFSDGSRLYFNDQRKFGWVKLLRQDKVAEEPLLAKLGREPLAEEFTTEYLADRLKNRRSAIKAALLDQTVASGVGNIYSDEALHWAQLHPLMPANQLSLAELERLRRGLRAVMEQSIERGGTSFTSYINALGKRGDYLAEARVFGRFQQPCPECGEKIEKIRVAQRGTHICPQCQQLKL